MSDLHLDDDPTRWFVEHRQPHADVAGALNRDGARRFNATAWIAAAGGIATIIGGVIGFGLACAWIIQSLP